MKQVYHLLKELMSTHREDRFRFVLATFLAAAASGSSVALMGVSAWLISRAAEMPPVLYLQAAAVGVRFFGISRGVFRYVERLVGHDVALRMQSALRVRTYDKLSRTTLIGRRRGDLLTRVVSDVAAVQDLVVRVAIPALAASLVITGTSIMLARFNWRSALVLFVTAVLAGVVVPLLGQRLSRRADLAAVPTRGLLADHVRETTRTSTDLLAYGAVAAALDRIAEADEQLKRQEARAAWVRGIGTAIQVLAAGVAVVAALAIGGEAVVAGDLRPRLLAVLVLTPLALHEVFQTFIQAAQTYTRSRVALTRIGEVLDEEPVGRGDVLVSDAVGSGIQLNDVSVGWPGHQPVLTGLDLDVSPGERVALVGPSGSGKTTVAATIMGLIDPASGDVVRGGRVGYLAQDAHVFATSMAENIRIGNKDATDDDVARALDRAGLPVDPGRVVGEAGSTLSGGERRRLALARVLADQRDVLILDEPTEHLDQETAEALMADVWLASRGLAVLVLTHDPGVIAQCHRVVSLA